MSDPIEKPTNLEECYEALTNMLTVEDRHLLKNLESEKEACRYHHGFGTWLRNNWGLWSGGPLKEYFVSKGLFHADDMSSIIMQGYYCHLTDKPFNLTERVQHYRDYWEKSGVNPDTGVTEGGEKVA